MMNKYLAIKKFIKQSKRMKTNQFWHGKIQPFHCFFCDIYLQRTSTSSLRQDLLVFHVAKKWKRKVFEFYHKTLSHSRNCICFSCPYLTHQFNRALGLVDEIQDVRPVIQKRANLRLKLWKSVKLWIGDENCSVNLTALKNLRPITISDGYFYKPL